MNRRHTDKGLRKTVVMSLQTDNQRPATRLSEIKTLTAQKRACSPVKCRSSRQTSRTSSDAASRPYTAAVMVGRFAQCERVEQLEREVTRCPSLGPPPGSSAAKRCKAPPWQKHCTPLVPYLVGPGYILSRGKTRFDVTKGTCGLNLTPEEEEQQKLQGEAEREALIAQLQQQISDLTLFLEEERLNHRQTKQKAEEYLRDRLDQLQSQHKEHTREVTARHKEEALKQKIQLDAEFTEYQTNTENNIRKLSKDIEQLHGAFEAYKSCLQDELQEKWMNMEKDLKAQCQQAVDDATQEMKSQVAKEKAADKAEAAKEQRRSIETLRKEHKKDMDNVVRTYSAEAAGMERLKKISNELTDTVERVDTAKEQLEERSSQLASSRRVLRCMEVQLMEYEDRLQLNVEVIKGNYKEKVQEFMAQGAELRKMYTDKCGQLFNQVSNSDTRVQQQISEAKVALESLKIRMDPKPGPSNASPPRRSASTPGTPKEAKLLAELKTKNEGTLHRPDHMGVQQEPKTE